MTTARVPGASASGTRRSRGRPGFRRRGSLQGSLAPYLLPALAVLAAIMLVPILSTIQISLTDFNFLQPGRGRPWVGLDNYASLLRDGSFQGAVWRTVAFTAIAVFLELLLGFLMAAALNVARGSRRVLVGLLIIPMILTPVIVGLMFNFALNPLFGPLTAILDSVGISAASDVLGAPASAFVALILVDVWQWTPFMALILWAGMQALPTPPLEAAAVDGATIGQQLRLVVLPMLLPVVVVAIIFRASEAVREFDKVFVLTGGGPGSATEVLDLLTYRTAFVNWDMGLAAAMGVVVFLAALASAFLFFRVVTSGGRVA